MPSSDVRRLLDMLRICNESSGSSIFDSIEVSRLACRFNSSNW